MGDRLARDQHEIRTRLTSISLVLQLLARRTVLSERQRALVQIALEQAAALANQLDRAALATTSEWPVPPDRPWENDDRPSPTMTPGRATLSPEGPLLATAPVGVLGWPEADGRQPPPAARDATEDRGHQR